MCGISGLCNPKLDLKVNIERMLDQIVHRGPDDSGIWIDPLDSGVAFGHRRLSIIDLTENGSQPMVSHDRRYVICYNGEIYNHSYVLEQMRADGYSDKMNGTSDTEILLEAISFYGAENAIKKCKGMFAIALYDRENETLLLARDRIGEKPLYYGIVNGGFAFASEINAIRAVEGFNNPVNTEVLGIYLTYGYIPAPYSIYKNIWKLEPGTRLKIKCRINNNRTLASDSSTNTATKVLTAQSQAMEALAPYLPEFTKYWSLHETAEYGKNHKFDGSYQDAIDELERLLTGSIRGQMVADVPLGAFMSAGIDSTTVVSLMQSISDKPVRTFTIGFETEGYNEAEAACEIAKHLGTKHTELYVSKQDALDVIPLIPQMFGEPFGDSSQIPTYLVSKMAREHVTVSLSGDGGDELFGGYRTYTGLENIWNRTSRFPGFVRSFAGSAMAHAPIGGNRGRIIRSHGVLLGAHNPSDLYRRSFQTDPLIRKMLSISNGLPYKYNEMDESRFSDPAHSAMLMDMEMYHPDDILVKVDRAAMAVSLESRVPMLDKDVVEFAWTLPNEYIRRDGIGKSILREVLYRRVPKTLMDRPKTGFSIPVKEWVLEPGLREWAEELLNPNSINKHNLIDSDMACKCWNDYKDKGIWRVQIWYLLMLESWANSVNL